MAAQRILPLRSLGKNKVRGVMRLTSEGGSTALRLCIQSGSLAEPCAFMLLAGGNIIKAALRSDGSFLAEAGFHLVRGAIIASGTSLAAMASFGISNLDMDKALTSARISLGKSVRSVKPMPAEQAEPPAVSDSGAVQRQNKQADNAPANIKPNNTIASGAASKAEANIAPQSTSKPAAGAAGAYEDPEPKSKVAKELLLRSNKLFAPPDDNAEPFIPRPYVRDNESAQSKAGTNAPQREPVPPAPRNAVFPAQHFPQPQQKCNRSRMNSRGHGQRK